MIRKSIKSNLLLLRQQVYSGIVTESDQYKEISAWKIAGELNKTEKC